MGCPSQCCAVASYLRSGSKTDPTLSSSQQCLATRSARSVGSAPFGAREKSTHAEYVDEMACSTSPFECPCRGGRMRGLSPDLSWEATSSGRSRGRPPARAQAARMLAKSWAREARGLHKKPNRPRKRLANAAASGSIGRLTWMAHASYRRRAPSSRRGLSKRPTSSCRTAP
jgi:hypothetical protein